MKVDIYIYEDGKKSTSGILIPWNPAEIKHDTGKARLGSYEVLDWGTVEIPSGRDLGTISWSGIFPGKMRKDLKYLNRLDADGNPIWEKPRSYYDQLVKWKSNGTPLRLLITNTQINHDVYLTKFIATRSGGHGDMSYDIEFRGRRTITIKTKKKSKTTGKKTTTRKTTTTTYKVKKGDTLWGISKKYLGKGSRWKEIYKLNKSIIEKTAKKHGKKSSDGGHWIYPGTKLKLPKK